MPNSPEARAINLTSPDSREALVARRGPVHDRPAKKMMPSPDITFRPAIESDAPFLRTLRQVTMRGVVLRHRPWIEEEQERRVMIHFASARIILTAGREIGLLKVIREPDYVSLVQVQLLPSYQGLGIGTGVIRGLQEECGAAGLPIMLEVYVSNRALSLYTRLGFEIAERLEYSYTMRWQKNEKVPNTAPEPATTSVTHPAGPDCAPDAIAGRL